MTDTATPELKLLGTLFANDRATVLVSAIADLAQPVGDGGYTPPELKVEASDVPLSLFGQAASFTAGAGGTVAIHRADAEVPDLFVKGETYRAEAGNALAAVDVHGRLGLDTTVPAISSGALTLSITGSAAAELRYRHLLPVGQKETRANALARLLANTELPQTVRIERLLPGEVHRLDGLLNLSLGVEAKWGKELDLEGVLHLWDGLAAEVRADVAASIQATLGWSLYEEMKLTVGRANLLSPDRVRIRLHRIHNRRLTLGVVVRVLVAYDASSVAAVLQKTLDQSPLPRVVESLRPIAEGSWDEIRGKLTNRATATLVEFLDDTGWKEKLQSSDALDDLVKLAQDVVGAYDGLGQRVQSLWDRLLGSAGLAPDEKLHDALQTVAGLKGQKVTKLTDDPEVRAALDLFEALAGESVEDLLMQASAQAQEVVDTAAGLAERALGFLDSLPDDVMKKLNAYAERLHVATTLGWLRDHATSKDDLLAAVEETAQDRIRQLVERLLGKAWDAISADDLARVQGWATNLLARLDSLQTRLKEVLEKFEGELGFSLALTFDRLTRDEALIDLEVDPRDPRMATDIPKALLGGRVRGLLEALPDLVDDDKPPSYLLREGVLSHRRVRTNSLNAVFSFLGLKSVFRSQSQWAEEANLKIASGDQGFEREGRYSGGLLRLNHPESARSESAVWLEIRAADDKAPKALAPFEPQAIHPRLTISYSYTDAKTQSDEQAALDSLLATLGFIPQATSLDNVSRRFDGATVETRFAVNLEVGENGVRELLAVADDEGSWDEGYLRAAEHWYLDPPQPAERFLKTPLGPGLADLVRRPDFRAEWHRGPDALTQWARSPRFVTVEGEKKRWSMLRGGVPSHGGTDLPNLVTRWKSPFNSLLYLSFSRPRGLASFRSLVQRLQTAESVGTQDVLLDVARQAAKAFKRTYPGDLTVSWGSPLFIPWLVLVHLSPATRSEVRGIATLRWRKPQESESWSDVIVWTVEGLPPL